MCRRRRDFLDSLGRPRFDEIVRWFVVRLVAAMVVVGVVGCSSPARVSVTGTLREVGGVGVDRPVAGSVEARQAGTAQTTRATVQDDGRFTLQLSPGSYTFVGHSPLYGDNVYVCRPETEQEPVVVAAEASAQVDVVCEIR